MKLLNENLKKASIAKQKENVTPRVPSPRKSSVIFTISSESSASSMFDENADENTNIPSVVTKGSEDNTKFFLLSDDEDITNEAQLESSGCESQKKETKPVDGKEEIHVDSKIKEGKFLKAFLLFF